jgi:hypothetical protein
LSRSFLERWKPIKPAEPVTKTFCNTVFIFFLFSTNH